MAKKAVKKSVKKTERQQKTTKRGFIFWLPRVLLILFALFLELFALDTPFFSLGFLMHSLPSIVLLLIVILAWNRPKVAGWIMVAAAIFFAILIALSKIKGEDGAQFVILSVIPLVIGVLYLIEGRK